MIAEATYAKRTRTAATLPAATAMLILANSATTAQTTAPAPRLAVLPALPTLAAAARSAEMAHVRAGKPVQAVLLIALLEDRFAATI